MIPLIIFLSYKMGAWWMNNATSINFSSQLSIKSIRQNLTQYIYGSITLAIIAAVVFGLISYLVMKILKNKNKQLQPNS